MSLIDEVEASAEAFLETFAMAELPVAEGLVEGVVAEAPELVNSSTPLTSFGQVFLAAAKKAEGQAISIGVASLSVAVAKAVAAAQGGKK